MEIEHLMLNKDIIKEYINISPKPEIFLFESIDSTNSEAKRRIVNGFTEDAVFVAKHQTAGRGRCGKSFYSPANSGLYFSALLHPDTDIEDTVSITTAAAVVVANVIEKQTKKHPKIKWVNDIFIDNKKVCGILAEAISDFKIGKTKVVIIGIGINLTTENFPDDISQTAGNVGEISDINLLVAELFCGLKDICAQLKDKSFMDSYREKSLVLGKRVSFSKNGIDYSATALDILNDGSLKVLTENGETMYLNSGEVSVRL